MIPSNWLAKGFCCLPVGVPDPVVLLRDPQSQEGEWGWLLPVGGVGHTMAVLAKLGILELLLRPCELLSVGIWLLS